MTITKCPPAAARGAESSRPFARSKTRSTLNNYGRLQRTERRDNVKPGDVLSLMGNLLMQHPKKVMHGN